MIRLVRVVRNVEFGELFDDFFVTAITTILLIRFYLKVTGYPQIGGSTLHISHLLPGSLLMLVAILILLAAVNRGARNFSAILAGIGFGLDWDELGKFITKNNNYFFHATPGLIYLTFVILYLIVRYSARRRFTEDDYMANVLDLLKDAAIKDLDMHEYEHAKELFAHVSKSHVLYGPTKEILEKVKPTAASRPSFVHKIFDWSKRPLLRLSERPFFSDMIVAVAVSYGFVSIGAAAFLFAGATFDNLKHLPSFLQGDESDIIGGLSALASAVCAGVGAYKYSRGQHARAYRFFEIGLLINIFIGQVVLFFKSQEVALAWLAVTLFLLVNLKLLSTEEAARKKR